LEEHDDRRDEVPDSRPDDTIADAQDLEELVARLRHSAEASTDTALGGLALAAEELLRRWGMQSLQVRQLRRAMSEALATEAATRARLDAILGAADLFDALDAPAHSPQPRLAEPLPAAARSGSGLRVHLFGPFRLYSNGALVELWRGSKTSKVFHMLVARSGTAVPRDVLIDSVWPDVDLDTGRRNLHQSIYLIRRTLRSGDGLDHPLIQYANESYSINSGAGLWRDVDEFEHLVTRGRIREEYGRVADAAASYENAVAIYVGDFLEDCPYEEWALAEREHWRAVFMDVANRLGDLRLRSGAVEAALDVSRDILRRNPADESSHRRAMKCFAQREQNGMVVRQYRLCTEALHRVYGATPSDETTQLFLSITGGGEPGVT
jgi:DNA-binding SARP family transcriptional activator